MSDLIFCEGWGEKMVAQNLEDLSPEERMSLQKHLTGCPRCAKAYEAFKMLETRIRELPQAGPLPSLLPKLQSVQQDPSPFFANGTFSIEVECSSGFAEVISEEVEKTELAIEDAMGYVLLKLFDGGMVEDIRLRLLGASNRSTARYSIQIFLQCPIHHFTLSPRTQEHMLGELRTNTYRMLKELFTSITMKDVTMLKEQKTIESDVSLEFG